MSAGSTGPLFIHAWWRSGSTYLWALLRKQAALKCFYEPLHEGVAELDIARVEARVKMAARSKHPTVDRNYRWEYANLVRAGRVGYTRDLAYARFLLAPDEPDERLAHYLRGLLEDAQKDERRPVLAFCRSQMRAAWMARRFSAVHVAQVRNPAAQFESFKTDPYFFRQMLTIAGHLRRRSPESFAHLAHFSAQADAAAASGRAKLTLPMAEVRQLFLLLWGASTIQALSACDQVVDLDIVSRNGDARVALESWWGAQGVEVDLSDCSLPGWEQSSTLAADFREPALEAAAALANAAAPLVVADKQRLRDRLEAVSGASRFLIDAWLAA